MAVEFIITDAGRAEVLNAAQNGFAPRLINEIGLGTGVWSPDPSATALQAEFKRVSTIAGGAASPTTLHVNGSDRSDDDYEAFELGLYLDTGTLFAIVSQPIAIVSKSESSSAFISADVEMTGQVTPSMVTFGDTNFVWNAATELVEGLVQLATAAEAIAGANGTKAVTPLALASALALKANGAQKNTATGPTVPGLYTWASGGVPSVTIEFGAFPGMPGVFLRMLIDGATADGIRLQSWDAGTSAWVTAYVIPNTSGVQALIDTARAFASLAEAQAGVDATKVMSPLRTKDAIDAQRAYVTKAQAEAGTLATGVMTPLRVKEAIDEQRPIFVTEEGSNENGEWRRWNNGRVEVWKRVTVSPSPSGTINVTITLPVAIAVAGRRRLLSVESFNGRYISEINLSNETTTSIVATVSEGNASAFIEAYITGIGA